MSVYDADLTALDGTPGVLTDQKGKVTLLVNVASKCGLTPQYTQLEELQKRLADRGFTVDWSQRHTVEGSERFHCFDPFGNRVEILTGG